MIFSCIGTTDDSSDEDLLTFKWELMGGPLQALKEDETHWNEALLKLSNPSEGTYTFK